MARMLDETQNQHNDIDEVVKEVAYIYSIPATHLSEASEIAWEAFGSGKSAEEAIVDWWLARDLNEAELFELYEEEFEQHSQ